MTALRPLIVLLSLFDRRVRLAAGLSLPYRFVQFVNDKHSCFLDNAPNSNTLFPELAWCSFRFCSVTAVDVHKNIILTTDVEWQQYIDAPAYYRGSIRCDHAMQAIYLTDSSGSVVRQFITNGELEADVFWFVDRSDDYTFHLVPQTDMPTRVDIELHALALKADQSLSPAHAIMSPLLAQTAERIAQHENTALEMFWQTVNEKGTPLIEDHRDGQAVVTFLYQGDASTQNVLVFGAPYDGQAYLTRMANSDIWFKSYCIPDSSRLSYRLAVNVPQLAEENGTEQYLAAISQMAVDSRNNQPPFIQPESMLGPASTVTLPQAPCDAVSREASVPKGRVSALNYFSHQLGNTRVVRIYQPNAVYELNADSPLLILFDGRDYLTKVPTPVILDNLIAAGHIPAMRAVFIDTPGPALRAQELTPNAAYADFLATEFKPWLCEKLHIHPAAGNTILSGSSYGGLASMYIAFQYPHQFGKVLSQSGSFWWAPEASKEAEDCAQHWFADIVSQAPTQPIDIYMNAGVFEINPKSHEILDNNRILADTLKKKGYPVCFEEIACGHDYFSWRVTLARGLRALFRQENQRALGGKE